MQTKQIQSLIHQRMSAPHATVSYIKVCNGLHYTGPQ